ncbi:protein of unknown function DUF785 [candidate division TM7 genomosp. GTL1]|nr:protein of unknown function DUF785 [candidate division TM7 genomosp. GTL1]
MNNRSDVSKAMKIVGRAEKISFPELDLVKVPAKIDTGAESSAIWASNIEEKNGELSFTLFDTPSEFYTGKPIKTRKYDELVVVSSNGQSQQRFRVQLLVKIKGKKVRGSFTLANRTTQVYPVLVGRKLLLGKFLVDVRTGRPLRKKERQRSQALQSLLSSGTVKR